MRRERLRTARLYFVCDARPNGEDPEPLLKAAIQGGVDIVQLREKSGDVKLIERAAQTFRRVCENSAVPFFLNDDPELAASVGADGVHIGQDDFTVEEARRLVGPDRLVGLSTHSKEQIDAAAGVDHFSVGPIWETPTKQGRPAVGLDLVTYAAKTKNIPFFAIGGINADNIGDVLKAGARRICVVRAIHDAADPSEAAFLLRRAFASVGSEVLPGA